MMTAPVADPIDVAAAPSPQSVKPEATATPPASATPTPSPSDLPSIPDPQVEPNGDDVKASPSPPAQAPAQAPATTPTRAPAPAPVPSTAPPAVPAPSSDPQPEPEPPAPQEIPPTVATWWDYGAHSFSAELNVIPGRSPSVIVDGSVLATTTTAGNRVTVSVQTPRSIYDLPVSFQYNDGAGESSGTMTGAEWIALAG